MIKVVGGVLIKDQHLFLARRASQLKNFPNLYEFPGGKIEKGETAKEALKRELNEELQIKVNIEDIEAFKNNNHCHTVENNGKRIDFTLFIVGKWEGNMVLNTDIHSEIKKIKLENIDFIEEMIPGDKQMISSIKKSNYYLRNRIKSEERSAKCRWSDSSYYLTKIISKVELIKNPNPIFTQEDLNKKLEILEIKSDKECFVTGKPAKGVGDHLYEINGYFKHTKKRGFNDEWNVLPVCGDKNKNYKKFNFMMNNIRIKKDVGYEDLSEEEFLYLISSENEEEIKMANLYEKIRKWKDYVKTRGARLNFEETEVHKNLRIKFKEDFNKFWDIQINELLNIVY